MSRASKKTLAVHRAGQSARAAVLGLAVLFAVSACNEADPEPVVIAPAATATVEEIEASIAEIRLQLHNSVHSWKVEHRREERAIALSALLTDNRIMLDEARRANNEE